MLECYGESMEFQGRICFGRLIQVGEVGSDLRWDVLWYPVD